MARIAGRSGSSLPHKLEALQRCGRAGAPLFTAVPLSGRMSIEDMLDEAAEMKSALGWEQMAAWMFLDYQLEADGLFAASSQAHTHHISVQAWCCWALHAMAATWCRTPASQWLRRTALRATPCSSGDLSPASGAAASGQCRSSGGCKRVY